MNNFTNIPQELKNQKRWVLWKKKILEDGKTTKMPINAKNGYGAKSNDSNTWVSFDEAVDLISYFNADGIGFMLGDGYVGIDIDHCIDNTELVKEFVESVKTYGEYSQSGTGLHFIFKGTLPNGSKRKGNIEMYDNARFFVMTGNKLNDYDICEVSNEVAKLYYKYLCVEETKPDIAIGDYNGYVYERPRNESLIPASLDDNEVLTKAMESRNGQLFSTLYDGKWEGIYNSQSEADLSFCSLLAFWCGRDKTQMNRIFRQSGLYREKWDRKQGATTYGNSTLDKAIRECRDIYEVANKTKATDKARFIKSKNYDLNDTGNAERFIDRFGEDLRYNHENKCWLLWDGKTWIRDPKQIVKNKVDDLIEEMKEEAINEKDEEYANALIKNIKHLSNNGGKEAMLKEAQHIGKTGSVNADFDKDKYLLNCENGIVNLRTGELQSHNKDLMMSKNTHICVDFINEPTIWLKTLDGIFKGSKELIDYVHKAIGYSLTGDVKEQCFFQCYGNGSNGKSVFFNTIYSLLGDYTINADVNSVLTSKISSGGNARPDIARLNGARFVRTNEPDETARFNEGLVKQLTGGDPITARFLFGGDFEFKPIFKLWIATNYKINVQGTDKGLWRRMRLIPFEACFEGTNNDKNLEVKLKGELPQILAWAIKGCIKWEKEGLETPSEVVEATQTYRTEMDIIEKFSQNCLIKDRNAREKAGDLFEEYISWCKRSNETNRMSQTKFGIEMGKKYEKLVFGGYKYYLGIKLIKHDTSYIYEKEKEV